jgi:hypothetical protein
VGTLQAAIDAAGPGDVLELLSGEFDGDIDINKALTFRPAPGAYPVVRFTTPGAERRPFQANRANANVLWEDIPIVFNYTFNFALFQAFPNVNNARLTLRRVAITDTAANAGSGYGIYQSGALGGTGSGLLLQDCQIAFKARQIVYTDTAGSSVSLERTRIRIPEGGGAALVCVRGEISMDRCLMESVELTSSYTHYLEVPEASIKATNSVFHYNTGNGPLLRQAGGNVSYRHCTFVDRRSGGTLPLGSILLASSDGSQGNLEVSNCLFDVTPQTVIRATIDTNRRGYGSNNKITFTIGHNHLTSTNASLDGPSVDPIYLSTLRSGASLLAPDQIHLQELSSARELAPASTLSLDYDGDLRPYAGGADFGADEYTPAESSISTAQWQLYR